MSQIAEYGQTENPYRATTAAESPVDSSLDALVSELRAFVGLRADYYIRKWAPRLVDSEGDVGTNWAAFFLPFTWLCYRKMYRFALIFTLVLLAEAVVQEVVFVSVLGMATTPVAVHLIVNVLASIICGLYGNAWYLSHATRIIADVRAQGYDDHQVLRILARRGGTSMLAAIGVSFLVFVVSFVIFLVLAIMLHAGKYEGI